MTIYEITDDIKALVHLIDESTIDEEGNPREMSEDDRDFLKPMMDELEINFNEKLEHILKYRTNLQAYVDGLKEEEARLHKRRKTTENKITSLQWLLEDSMRKIGAKKIEAGTFTISMQKNPPYAFITNEFLLPENYLRIIPEKREPDKKLILDALKSGQPVPGAMISQGESLRVR